MGSCHNASHNNFAFIQFATSGAADRAMEKMNGEDIFGRRIVVNGVSAKMTGESDKPTFASTGRRRSTDSSPARLHKKTVEKSQSRSPAVKTQSSTRSLEVKKPDIESQAPG